MIDIHDFYDEMERENIMLSFKGEVTSELLTSILQIMESKLDNISEAPKVKRKVFNVLVECLQNLYHHMDESPVASTEDGNSKRKAVFMIGKTGEGYRIISGNYMHTENVSPLQGRLDEINSLDRDGLKALYKQVLNNGQVSEKGGGGLGMIDIARKSGHPLAYNFTEVNEKLSFFTLNILIS
ncbi:MAG: SiaB family protein kinase [Salibacteraceae bacterium]